MSAIHTYCPECGSKNNRVIFENGSEWCYTPDCNYRVSSNGSTPMSSTETVKEFSPVVGEYVDIPSRGITAETCKKPGYIKGKHGGEDAYFWPIYDKDRRLTGYKIRKKNKQFLMQGSNPDKRFLGQEKCPNGGKLLVIFEGEYDALAYMEVRKTWPCVSLPSGAESATPTIKAQLPWLLLWETVILCCDHDDAGQKAAKRAIQLLPPRVGKIGVVEGHKDASEALVARDHQAILRMVWDAKEYEPDGIINANKLLNDVLKDPQVDSASYGYSFLDEHLKGLRKRELVCVTAGTGQGKSTLVRHFVYNLVVSQGLRVAQFNLEESNIRSARAFVGIHLNHPLHIDKGDLTDEQIETAFNETLGTGRLYLYDHFGSLAPDVLLNRIRYCITSLDCDYVVLDHLSILVSGMEQAQDERRAIDYTMTKLRSLVEETGCGMILVSHLRRPQGTKGYEDGQQTSLSGLRGSASISQLADICLGLERDQQASDNSVCQIRVLKNRFTGWLGLCGSVKYHSKTGRMLELSDNTPELFANVIEPDF